MPGEATKADPRCDFEIASAPDMPQHAATLNQVVGMNQTTFPGGGGALSGLLTQISLAGKYLAHDLRRAGLLNILGTTGGTNVQGEDVKKLDEIANATFVRVLRQSDLVCALASEEMAQPLILSDGTTNRSYMVLFDPLDGSSNTDVNMPLGSIFSVVLHRQTSQRPKECDLVRKGTEQIAAGYLLFGASTILVYTAGRGVRGFTLDPGIGEFLLSHEAITIPARGRVYAANEGNTLKWSEGMRRYFDYLKVQDKMTGRPYSTRYSGCLVADVHRLLLGGGIYLYPSERDKPEGKIRLLYEANPLAMVVEQAGGKASTGTMRILDVEAKTLHQRVPLIIGSRDDVTKAEEYIQGRA
jgi:fructose-1,6-bisphosphatase I